MKNEFLLRLKNVWLLPMLFLFFMAMSLAGKAQTVTTDKLDYVPSDRVTITGSGWTANEKVNIVIEHLIYYYHENDNISVTANDQGEIYYDTYFISEFDWGENFRLTATGLKNNLVAVTYFTDGATMAVSPIAVCNTNQSYTFTFGNGNAAFSSGSYVLLKLPEGWTNPTGHVTVNSGSGGGAFTSASIPTAGGITGTGTEADPWTIRINVECSNGSKSFTLSYGEVAPPSTAGTYQFTTQYYNASGPLTASVAIQPTVMVGAVGGNITGDASSCSSASGKLELNGYTGTQIDWYFSTTSASGPFNQVNGGGNVADGAQLNLSNITQTTWYRATVTNGACSAYSDVKPVFIYNTPVISASNILSYDTYNPAFGEEINVTVTSLPDYNVQYFLNYGQSSQTQIYSGYTFPVGQTTVSVVATNTCGTTLSSFTVTTGIPPQITCPEAITQNTDAGLCSAVVDYELTWDGGTASATPAVGHYIGSPKPVIWYSLDGTTYTTTTSSDSAFPKGTTTVYLKAVNDAGTASCSFTVTVVDKEAPAITLPGTALTMECYDATAVANWIATASALDNCNGSVSVTSSYTPPTSNCNQTVEVTFSATDACNNLATATKTFIVDDNTAPAITLPGTALTMECYDATAVANWIATASALDNCNGSVSVTSSYTPPTSNCNQTVEVTFSATDACNNLATATKTFIVDDNTAPAITLPGTALTMECYDATAVANWIATASALDNCNGSVSVTSSYTPPTSNCNQTVEVTFSATDACNNLATATKTFIVDDNTAPAITLPGTALTMECYDATAVANWIATASALDNCNGSVSVTSSYTPPTSNCNQTVEVTFSATDACNNLATATKTFIVDDNTAPAITLPGTALTMECYDATAVANWIATASALDNCNGSVSVTSSYTPPTSNCNQTVEVTFSATDACNNLATATKTFIVDDNTAPAITLPGTALTMECYDATAVANWIATASALDNCNGSVSVTSSYTPPTSNCNQTVEVTFSATDACNNLATATKTFIVDDNTAPAITLPGTALTMECYDATAVANWIATASALDNCNGSVSVTSSYTPPTSNCNQTVEVTFSATDACNNLATATKTFIVDDNTAPAITLPGTALTMECYDATAVANWIATASALDNCNGSVSVTSSYTPPTSNCNQTIEVTFSATDACNNLATATKTFIVDDNTAPAITLPGTALTMECYDATAVANWIATASALDNCNGSVSVTSSYTPPTSNCNQTVEVTFSATDACNNLATATKTFIVDDNTAPAITLPGTALTMECYDATAVANWIATASALDNCNGSVSVTSSYTPPTSNCNQTVEVTFSATDACNNLATATKTFIVDDNTAPQITAPVTCGTSTSVTTEIGACTYIAGNEFNATATDNCSGDVTLYVELFGATTLAKAEASSLNNQVFNPGTTHVTWTAVDACGNDATCSFDVVVKIPTTTTVHTSADAARYKDNITLYAEIEGVCEDFELTGTVQFYIDGNPVGTPQAAYMIPEGEEGAGKMLRATLIHNITELPWETDYATKTHKVEAFFVPDGEFYDVSDDDSGLKIYPREAEPFAGNASFYTGPLFAWTTSESSSTGTVLLSAIITDPEKTGDVRGAQITFYWVDKLGNYTPVPSGKNLPVSLVTMTDGNIGTASVIVQLNLGKMNSEEYTVAVQVTGGYTNDYTEKSAQATFTLAKPVAGGYIVGGGEIIDNKPVTPGQINNESSSGLIRGAAGSSTGFSFEVVYNNKMINPQGKAFVTFDSWYKPDGTLDGVKHHYRISSNAIALLSVGKSPLTPNQAIFNSKANLEEHIYTLNDQNEVIATEVRPIEGGSILELRMTDVEDDFNGKLGIQLNRKAGGIWFSSKWDGTKTLETDVATGSNIYVSTANTTTAPTSGKKAASIIDLTLTEAKVNVFPNPFTEKLFFEFTSPTATDARLEIFSITGAKIATLFDAPIEAGRRNKAEYVPTLVSSQMVIYRLTMNGETRIGKMVYQERQ